ncbi:uncharacterized protein LOC123227518 isoform X2 [Mangifera indica]|uniref:uncharacterized protein LOC123227518 isoform X2 n=1 Tax=Mangifera indica TaxID=29780 RepID=UPI001CFB9B02|nr:uncharacterized protein LOC123227518 isoform X2 [Mangifera indica]
MAADVSYFLSLRQESNSNSEILITKDLLGGLSKVSNSESDLGSKYGEERARCKSPNTPLSSISASENSDNRKNLPPETNPDADFQDLNYPPPQQPPQINHFLEETCLDLKLQSSSSHYQSVCTLDKVKSALQRAQKRTLEKKQASYSPGPPSVSSSSSSSSGPGMFAAGCPGCLLYVVTLKANPKCPRCNTTVPFQAAKKAKIDLNSSF